MAHLGPHLYTEDSSDDEELVEPASDVFEIDDFTCPSDWEKFVARLEHLVREWKLSGPRPNSGNLSVDWSHRSSVLEFYDFQFLITHYFRQPTCPDLSDDATSACTAGFPTKKSHPVHYFYGLNEYVVLSPNVPHERETIDNETRAKQVIGTALIAVNNTDCHVPFFVQVMDVAKAMYVGVAASNSFRTHFDPVVLSKKPPNCHHLSGLISLFKEKIDRPDVPSVRVTARCSYALEDWTCHVWSQPAPDVDIFAVNDWTTLPFGSTVDPVRRLILHATWSDLQEDIIVDNDVHSDLMDPMEAPCWSVSLQFEDRPHCLLDEYVGQFLGLCDSTETVKQLLGDLVKAKRPQQQQKPNDQDPEQLQRLPNVFNRLTGPTYTLTDIIESGKSVSSGQDGPISDQLLGKILTYLFPDSIPVPKHPYPQEFKKLRSDDFRVPLMAGIKSSPVGGLLWRLTIALSHCYHVLGGIKPFAHLVHEFMLEIRYRWESGIKLPGVPQGQPDHAYCLFHQKLQMLNCCIERKVSRESRSSTTSASVSADSKPMKNDDDSEEEEFFECYEDEHDQTEKMEQKLPIWNREASGRLCRFGKVKLLAFNKWMYVPLCQDPSPMTEDMLAEQAEVMLQLGMDSEGSALRAKMQSASLLSDMESFKAANPGSTLGDFVRWHSPRDWNDDQEEGLSARMKSEGNIWAEMWNTAKPVPAQRQKRLFDDTVEAEKVIQYLTALRPSHVAQLLLPNLLHVAVSRILEEGEEISGDDFGIGNLLCDAVKKLNGCSRLRCLPEVYHFVVQDQMLELQLEFADRAAALRDIAHLLRLSELKVSCASSLRSKFLKNHLEVQATEAHPDDVQNVKGHIATFVQNLLVGQPEVVVLGAGRGPTGQLVCKMFRDAKRAKDMILESDDREDAAADIFPRAVSKEFILRTWVGRPYAYSQPGLQRMYCCLKDNEFRLAGSFTIDKQFL